MLTTEAAPSEQKHKVCKSTHLVMFQRSYRSMFKLCRRSPNFKYNMVFTFLQFSLEQVHSVLFFWWSKQEISLLLALYILSFRYNVLCIKEHQFQVNCSCKISWHFSSMSARPLESFQSNCPNATHSVQWCRGLLCVGWLIFITHLWISETSPSQISNAKIPRCL